LYTANGIDIPLTRDLHPLVSWTHLWVPMDQNNCEVKILWGTKFTFHFAIWRVSYICIYIYTSIASWKKSTVISVPNNSSASLVNLLIIVHALKIASVINKNDVQTQTLQYTFNNYIYTNKRNISNTLWTYFHHTLNSPYNFLACMVLNCFLKLQLQS
jgi:hypothetical protein